MINSVRSITVTIDHILSNGRITMQKEGDQVLHLTTSDIPATSIWCGNPDCVTRHGILRYDLREDIAHAIREHLTSYVTRAYSCQGEDTDSSMCGVLMSFRIVIDYEACAPQ